CRPTQCLGEDLILTMIEMPVFPCGPVSAALSVDLKPHSLARLLLLESGAPCPPSSCHVPSTVSAFILPCSQHHVRLHPAMFPALCLPSSCRVPSTVSAFILPCSQHRVCLHPAVFPAPCLPSSCRVPSTMSAFILPCSQHRVCLHPAVFPAMMIMD
ncbi:hypothetical protein STEG23_011782, partial [Scotinomys teguina]